MDTKQVIARFEAERQALALMDHPNIAKVLDAGATESGRPYFVMELVRGVPITYYCDEKRLPLRDRLSLFLPVCQAVQHAHHKGIIHRDLKPSNVMVAPHDDRPVPKVIDFGVAKATDAKLTERTMFTEFGQLIGTVEYMSPEQAGLNQLDIDTRSDVYSLGVLLYELMTGTTPLERKRVKELELLETLRLVREEDPPKPSTRLSEVDDLPLIANNRSLETMKLNRVVRGELDWIVMKALEKDRNRRYETASALHRDVERYLAYEPVQACPPSAVYRFRKFARRNKAALSIAMATISAILLLVVGLAVSNRLIAAERNEKSEALTAKENALALAEAQRERASANFLRARVAIRELMTKLAVRGHQMPEPLRRDFSDQAIKYYQTLLQEENADPTLRYETGVGYRTLAMVHASWGEIETAEKCYRQAIAILEILVNEEPSEQHRQQLGYALARYGGMLNGQARFEQSQIVLMRGEEIYEELLTEAPRYFDYAFELAYLLKFSIDANSAIGRMPDAGKAYRRATELLQQLIDGKSDPDPYPAAHEGGFLLVQLGQTQEIWANALARAGRFDEATQAFRNAVNTYETARREHPDVPDHFRSLMNARRRLDEIASEQDKHDEEASSSTSSKAPSKR
jgi:tetratricopeptide (TPR) repeat protein